MGIKDFAIGPVWLFISVGLASACMTQRPARSSLATSEAAAPTPIAPADAAVVDAAKGSPTWTRVDAHTLKFEGEMNSSADLDGLDALLQPGDQTLILNSGGGDGQYATRQPNAVDKFLMLTTNKKEARVIIASLLFSYPFTVTRLHRKRLHQRQPLPAAASLWEPQPCREELGWPISDFSRKGQRAGESSKLYADGEAQLRPAAGASSEPIELVLNVGLQLTI